MRVPYRHCVCRFWHHWSIKLYSFISMIIFQSMASTDMDFGQLEAFLTSQTRKKEGGITEAQAKVYTKFWRNNKEKIHNCLIHNSNWNNRLHNLSWRIDINSRARHVDEINTPTAIVELQLTPPNDQKVVVGLCLNFKRYNLDFTDVSFPSSWRNS